MPELCRFYGIIIRMYNDDHEPPHFHAYYNEFSAQICINDFSILGGSLPPKAMGLIYEWTMENKNELLKKWELAKRNKPTGKIKPLR